MKKEIFFGLCILLGWIVMSATAGITIQSERPNILWIVSEDNSAYYIGCYGNEQAETPNIDRLAIRGNRYLQAYANAPVCAVARSTLLTGVYAPTMGTQHMRSRYAVPREIESYVTLLKTAGYYCTNADKTDYNIMMDDKSIWDACAPDAHYRDRRDDQPFFAVFNIFSSHEHCLFPESIRKYREQGVIPKTNRIGVDEVTVPPLYPDLPEIRQDLVNYYDAITRMDAEVGRILKELEVEGVEEDTIIFYYSDHGGVLPRSKRYVYKSGTQIPLVVYFPEKWKQLNPFNQGEKVEETVSFIDFAPTLLSLAGLPKGKFMQGRAFLGEHRRNVTSAPVYLYSDRFDTFYKFNRSLTDGRFRYIRNFYPHQTPALKNPYPYQMKSWGAFQDAHQKGDATPSQSRLWASMQPTEELYDASTDPWELENLAGSEAHQNTLISFREACRVQMQEVVDSGVIPEAMFQELSPIKPLYYYTHSPGYPNSTIIDLAFLASDQDPKNLSVFVDAMNNSHPVVRYWGLMGYLILQDRYESIELPEVVERLTEDAYAANRIRAAQLMWLWDFDKSKASRILLDELNACSDDAVITLLLNVFQDLNATDLLPQSIVQGLILNPHSYPVSSQVAELLLAPLD